MMAEKARLFQDHGAVRLIMSSPDPRAHKRVGRGVHNFDSVVWDGIWGNTVLAGTLPSSHETRP